MPIRPALAILNLTERAEGVASSPSASHEEAVYAEGVVTTLAWLGGGPEPDLAGDLACARCASGRCLASNQECACGRLG